MFKKIHEHERNRKYHRRPSCNAIDVRSLDIAKLTVIHHQGARCVKCAEKHLTKEFMRCQENNFKPKCYIFAVTHVVRCRKCKTPLNYLVKTDKSQASLQQEQQPRRFDGGASFARRNIQYNMATRDRQQPTQHQQFSTYPTQFLSFR